MHQYNPSDILNQQRDCRSKIHFDDSTHFSSLTRPSYINTFNQYIGSIFLLLHDIKNTWISLPSFSLHFLSLSFFFHPVLAVIFSRLLNGGIRHLMWFDGISTLFGAKRVSHQFPRTELPVFPDLFPPRSVWLQKFTRNIQKAFPTVNKIICKRRTNLI